MDSPRYECPTSTDNSYQVPNEGPNPILVFYFRVEEKFAGGKFREIPFAVDIIFAGGKFRAKSRFAKIAKIYSTRKIGVIGPYSMSRGMCCCHANLEQFKITPPRF